MEIPTRRIGRHVGTALLVGVVFTVLVRVGAEWLENNRLDGLDPAPFQSFTNTLQMVLIFVFGIILGSFIHRYPEPYFILWTFGWLSWLGLYVTRALHLPIGEAFNVLNSFFFLAAALDLLAPESWTRVRQYPPRPKKTFGSPLVWLLGYVRHNSLVLILFVPVILIASIRGAFPTAHLYLEGVFAIVSISLLGFGLYLRMLPLSPHSAVAVLIVHAVYLEPQLAKMVWQVDGNHPFDNLLMVLAPALVLKPALALFVTLLALRETDARREEAETRGLKMIENLPDACLYVTNGYVVHFNQRAIELLGMNEGERSRLESVFCSLDEFETFMQELRGSAEGRVLGHETTINVAGARPEYRACISVRLDAFYLSSELTPSRDEDIVILVLDRHELDLANAVYAVAHDFIQPRIRDLSGRLKQIFNPPAERPVPTPTQSSPDGAVELGLCDELLQVMDALRSEFRGFWHRNSDADERSSVRDCITIAWHQAKYSCGPECDCQPRLDLMPDPMPEDIYVAVSDTALVQVLQNTFKNAIQHTFRREKRQDISPIEVTVSATESWIVFKIADCGLGFSDAILRFLNSTKGANFTDIGMGLVTLKLVTARTGGTIRAGNKNDNGGGWIEVVLPAASGPVEPGLGVLLYGR